jgi:hypothetical protein
MPLPPRALLPLLALLALLVAACVACSGSSSSAGPVAPVVEAGADATADAGCFPFCGASSSGGEAGGDGGDGAEASCAELRAQVESLEGPARMCNPQAENQCGGTAQGICCPITVSAGNDTAANDFELAVGTYESQCDAGCLTPVCPATPSQDCQGAAAQGSCQ